MNDVRTQQADDESSNPTTENRTVLIVEDNPDLAYLWERYLTLKGCQSVSTPLGSEALVLAASTKPSAVILDIMLPEMNGWEILRELRTNQTTREIPVIMCSALDEAERGIAEGADEYLRKPVNLDTFLGALSRVGVS